MTELVTFIIQAGAIFGGVYFFAEFLQLLKGKKETK